nr:porin PorA family protein [Streptomyces sp. DSM 41633]
MHRNASPLSLFLLGAGVFLLVLAPLLVWYVQPQAKRTPIDTDTTTVFTGTGSYFDTGEVKTVTGKEITITRQVRGDVAESLKSGHAVWD